MRMFSVTLVTIFAALLAQHTYADDAPDGEISAGESLTNVVPQENQPEYSLLNINYFGIFYGPSVGNPTTGYQPDLGGKPDHDHPLLVRNFATFSHNFSDQLSLAATGYWTWQPVAPQSLDVQDPFLRLAYNSLVHVGGFNLYGDFRIHFPLSSLSQQMNEKLGAQLFEAGTYQVDQSKFMLGLYFSQRANFFGHQKIITYQGRYYWQPAGDDLEFYLAPNINYQVSPKVSITVLYEMYASHTLGQKLFSLNSDGTDLEPGVAWEITPSIMLNPYLNLLTGGKVSLNSTSFGMMLSINLI